MTNWVKEKDSKKIQMLEERYLGWITPKAVAVLLTVIYAVSLVPLLWISFYNYPSADDYSNAGDAHVAWMLTHNFFSVIWAGILRTVQGWKSWMGYFTCNFLTGTSPISFGERWYALTAVIVICILTASVIYLLYGVFVKCFQFDKYMSWSVIMLVLFITVQCMCPAGRGEAFYWYSGSAGYTLLYSLANFYFGTLLRIMLHSGKRRRTDMVIASVLGVLVGGGNHMTALNVVIVLFLAVVLITYHRKWKEFKPLIVPFVMNLFGFVVNIIAPGNWVRAEMSHGMGPVKAVFVSFYYCFEYCIGRWSTWSVLLLFLLIGLLAWKMTSGCKFGFQYPALVVFLSFCLTSAMMVPPLFAVGGVEAGRILSLTYMMYVLQAAMSVCYVAGWARYRYEHRAQNGRCSTADVSFSFSYRWAVICIVLCLLGGSVLEIAPNRHAFTYSSAMCDILNGRAKAFYEAQCERTALYYSGQEGIVEVDPLPTQHPELLYFSDITTDVGDWQNRGLARYLGIEGVVVKSEEGREQ